MNIKGKLFVMEEAKLLHFLDYWKVCGGFGFWVL
jgi:hypothetical protein